MIDRAPFNALVDDDGSNTRGTPWDKTAIKTTILDPVDGALPGTIGVFLGSTAAAGVTSIFSAAIPTLRYTDTIEVDLTADLTGGGSVAVLQFEMWPTTGAGLAIVRLDNLNGAACAAATPAGRFRLSIRQSAYSQLMIETLAHGGFVVGSGGGAAASQILTVAAPAGASFVDPWLLVLRMSGVVAPGTLNYSCSVRQLR